MEAATILRPSFLQFRARFSFPTPFHFSSPSQSPPPTPLRSQSQSASPRLRRRTSISAKDFSADDYTSWNNFEPVDPAFALLKIASKIGPKLKGTSINLLGMNCSVKTKLGKVLADALRYYYFDSDDLVAEAFGGVSAANAFESDAERYRESETEVLDELTPMGRLVICAGNGLVQSSTNLELLRHGVSIWIDVPLEIVAQEITQEKDPISIPEVSAVSYSEVLPQLATLYEKTKSGYATADATVSILKVAGLLGRDDLDNVAPQEMAVEVLKEIAKLKRVKAMMEDAARPY